MSLIEIRLIRKKKKRKSHIYQIPPSVFAHFSVTAKVSPLPFAASKSPSVCSDLSHLMPDMWFLFCSQSGKINIKEGAQQFPHSNLRPGREGGEATLGLPHLGCFAPLFTLQSGHLRGEGQRPCRGQSVSRTAERSSAGLWVPPENRLKSRGREYWGEIKLLLFFFFLFFCKRAIIKSQLDFHKFAGFALSFVFESHNESIRLKGFGKNVRLV